MICAVHFLCFSDGPGVPCHWTYVPSEDIMRFMYLFAFLVFLGGLILSITNLCGFSNYLCFYILFLIDIKLSKLINVLLNVQKDLSFQLQWNELNCCFLDPFSFWFFKLVQVLSQCFNFIMHNLILLCLLVDLIHLKE